MGDVSKTRERRKQVEPPGEKSPEVVSAEQEKQPRKQEQDPARERVEGRRIELMNHLIGYAIAQDGDVQELFDGWTANLAGAGRDWDGFTQKLEYLENKSKARMSIPRVSHSELSVPVRCRVIAAIFQFCLQRITAELAKVTDYSVVENYGAWASQLEAAYDAAKSLYYEQTYQYYLDVADKPDLWKPPPPFLAR